MTFKDEFSRIFGSGRNHAFVFHGSVRDLQLGSKGSLPLTSYLLETLSGQGFTPAVYRVGVGWTTLVESDKAKLAGLLGDTGQDDMLAQLAGMTPQDSGLPEDVAGAVDTMHQLILQKTEKVAVIVDRAELIAPSNSYNQLQPVDKVVLSQLQDIASNPRAGSGSRNIAIMITDSLGDLHESLRLVSGRWYAIQITNPDYEERKRICAKVLGSDAFESEVDADELARLTAGITRSGLMDVFLQAKFDGTLTRDQVKVLKNRIISQENGDLVSFIEPLPGGFDSVGGLDQIKSYWTHEVINPIRSGDTGDVPNGVLLAGAAGLGKTYVMRAVAEESKMTVVDFSVNRLLGSYVGQSEGNLERALDTIKACTPCIVVMDEIEQSFGDRASQGPSGDSGVSNRIFKRMLEVLSDTSYRGEIVWVGITNYPEKLDAAFSRAGRFDDVLPFFPPDETQIGKLIQVYLGKNGLEPVDVDLDLGGYTPAEVESVVRKAAKLVKREQLGVGVALEQAVMRTVSNTRSVASMTDSALRATSDLDLVPAEYQDRWRRLTSSQAPVVQVEDDGKLF